MASDDFIVDGLTENAVLPKGRSNYVPKSIIDNSLEYIDPTPNIHTLFIQFNKKFFYDTLGSIEVKWSNRMTTCAGICSFQPRSKMCTISLSAPLLKLRPRKDLVETLLHEMIHGYLFLNTRRLDRESHGPEFQKHMHRINREAGTNITIYHSFHDEVRLYQQHWWRCDGPCQNRAPYFGTVRRATNRAPGKNDFWFAEHQRTCGGTFIKIKEPESFKSKKLKAESSDGNIKSKNTKPSSKNNENQGNIMNWISGNKNSNSLAKPKTNLKSNGNSTQTLPPTMPKNNSSNFSTSSGIKKLGNSTNAVHGFGTGGPGSTYSSAGSSSSSKDDNRKPTNGYKFSFSGTIGGSSTGKSKLLDIYVNIKTSTPTKKKPSKQSNSIIDLIKSPPNDVKKLPCPICNLLIAEQKINEHLDSCLIDADKSIVTENSSDLSCQEIVESDAEFTDCPICNKKFKLNLINDHVEDCLNKPSSSKKRKSEDIIEILDSPEKSEKANKQICLICNRCIDLNVTLNEHLEDCIGDLFNDETIEGEIKNDEPKLENENKGKTKFPCPVCMKLVEEDRMNSHLDSCIL